VGGLCRGEGCRRLSLTHTLSLSLTHVGCRGVPLRGSGRARPPPPLIHTHARTHNVCLSACLSVSHTLCLSICLSHTHSVCLNVCLTHTPSVYLSVCLSHTRTISVCLPLSPGVHRLTGALPAGEVAREASLSPLSLTHAHTHTHTHTQSLFMSFCLSLSRMWGVEWKV
jgi:hypothetical protein